MVRYAVRLGASPPSAGQVGAKIQSYGLEGHAITVSSIVAATGFAVFLVVVVIDAGLATLVFRHAYRRQNRHATAWGVFTFLAAGIAIPVYFLTYWLRIRVPP